MPFHSPSVFSFKSLIWIVTLKGGGGRGCFFLIFRVTTHLTLERYRTLVVSRCVFNLSSAKVQHCHCGSRIFCQLFLIFFHHWRKGSKNCQPKSGNDNILLQCCSVAVLKRYFQYLKNTSIFIYKYRVYFDFSYSLFFNCNNCNTATPYRSLCVYLFDIEYVAMVAENFKIDGLQVRVFDFAAKNH